MQTWHVVKCQNLEVNLVKNREYKKFTKYKTKLKRILKSDTY